MPRTDGLRQRLPYAVTGLRILGAAFLSALLVLPFIDSRALENDPYHAHVVVGGNPTDQARALAQHLNHFSGSPQQFSSPSLPSGRFDCARTDPARVFSVHGGAIGSAVIGVSNAVAMAGRLVVLMPPRVDLLVVPSPVNPFEVILPVVDPPPRSLETSSRDSRFAPAA